MTEPRFGRVITAMITPMTSDLEVDFTGMQKLAKWLVDQGNDALVVCGTTGEAPVLSDEEKIEIVKTIKSAVSVPIIVGTSSGDTSHSVELTKQVDAAGADAILAVTPYYSRPSQIGIRSHFSAIAQATKKPVVLYDIPVRTGRPIQHSTVLSLSVEHANILAVKDASSDVANSAVLIRDLAAARLPVELYSGEDVVNLPLLSVGAVGVIGVATHWSAPEHQEMIGNFKKGDTQKAQQINASLIDSYHFESNEFTPNPMPAKAMMRVLNLPAGQCRLPIGTAPEDLEHKANQVLADLKK